MKRKIIIITLVLVSLVLLSLGIKEVLKYKSIEFSLDKNVSSIDIYSLKNGTDNGVLTKSINKSSRIWLKTGSYYYIPKGEIITNAMVNFYIKDNQNINVDPDYSVSHLNMLLSKEKIVITNFLKQKYPNVMPNFTVNNVALYKKGEWAGVLLIPLNMDINNPSGMYRTLIRKENDKWSIVGSKPQLILTVYNTPNTQKNLLQNVNNLTLQ